MAKKKKSNKKKQRFWQKPLTKSDLQKIKEKSKCQNCGTKDNLTIDHITKKEHGGKSHRNNIRILCWRCHQKRHANETPSFDWGKYK